jgi:two-component sensor histidine kinase/PAS domain-containing protein
MAPVPWPAVASLVAAAGTVLLIAHLRQFRGKPGANWFLASLGGQTLWAVSYGVGLLVFDPGLRWALEVLMWAGMAATSFSFLGFALAYTGRGDLLDGYERVLAAIPVAALVGGATNPVHGLLWTDFSVTPLAGMATVTYELYPWSVAAATVGIALVLVGSLLLFDTVASYGPLYRSEAVAVGLSTLPPVAALLAWLYGWGPVPELNLATTMFLPHVVLDAYAFVGSDMFEFHPATRRAGERAAIDDLGAPVVVVDEQGRVVTCNGAAERAFDTAKTAALTHPLADVVGADIDPADPEGAVTVQGTAGRTVYSVTSTPLSASGTHVGYTVVFQDVTEERRREQRLGVLNRVLRHNLRNDMTVVQGFVEAANERVDDEETAAMLDRAVAKADDLVAVGDQAREVERVLDRDVVPESVKLDPLVEEVVADYAGGHAVTVETDGIALRTDPAILRVVLGELLANAVEHGGPSVTVEGERRNGQVSIAVRDDGPGLPEHERAVLDAETETALEHGSGLGLWLARWGTARLGGELTVETDAGTTATVALPADEGVDR